jgi:tetratricopeptide (TPR) repeat protein
VSDEIAANIRARIRLQRAGAALRIGLLPEADADYAAAGTVIPDDPMIPFNRGEIALRQGDAEAAATFFKVAYDGANPTLRKLMWEAAAADDVLSVAWAAIVDESS